ncbi:MAG: hypothetical protein KA258_04055 [Deltaproteobacteria bacterium]|jgi:hypothetical protein|nr:hypothetical protein [Deltaproteobacteria bacterium]
MTKHIFASIMLLAGLASSGCDKTALNFENVPYEFFDLGGVDGATAFIPGRPLADAVQYDRVGRPLVSSMLINPFGFAKDKDYPDQTKDIYNGAVPMRGWTPYSNQPFIQSNLGVWDSLDANCGNQAGAAATASQTRYQKLGDLFTEDRLWVDTGKTACTRYMAVELKFLNVPTIDDCGGRSPGIDAVDQTYSLLVGQGATVSDGVAQDPDGVPSTSVFPFLKDAQ